MAELGINLYEANQQLMANEKPLDPIVFNRKTFECAKAMLNQPYWMLLCNDRKDYTVFRITADATERPINKELIETLKNRGDVLAIDLQKDGNYEIWIRDKKTKENFCYYLFNYSFGIIEV